MVDVGIHTRPFQEAKEILLPIGTKISFHFQTSSRVIVSNSEGRRCCHSDHSSLSVQVKPSRSPSQAYSSAIR